MCKDETKDNCSSNGHFWTKRGQPCSPSFPPFLRLSHAYFARHFQIQYSNCNRKSQLLVFAHTDRHTYVCVCACVYVLYIYSCCCCQLLPLLPEFLKRFAYFINRKCSLRATDKNNCYCHCRFSLSLLQVPPFPSAASDCSFNFSSDSN